MRLDLNDICHRIVINVISNLDSNSILLIADETLTLGKLGLHYLYRKGYDSDSITYYTMHLLYKDDNISARLDHDTLGEAGIKSGDAVYIIFK